MTALRAGLRFKRYGSSGDLNRAGGHGRRLIFNALAAAVLLYTVFFIIRMTISMLHGIHIPNEYREAANVDLTMSIIKGINPYSLAGLHESHPRLVFQYGPLFSLLVAGLHFVLPFIDVIVLHYLTAFVCVVAAGMMAGRIVRENTDTWLPCVSAFLFTVCCTWRYGYVNAVPDTLGVTLLVLVFFIETRKHLKYREYLEAVTAVALFYTKQYLVVIAVSLFIYKLITDKKGCIRLSAAGLLLLAGTMTAMQIWCPLYFTYSLLVVHGVSGQSTGAAAPLLSMVSVAVSSAASADYAEPASGWAYEWQQIRSLAGIFIFVFLGMAAGVVRAFRTKTPLFDGSRLFVIHTAVAATALLYFGQNDGAWLSYYLQMLMPGVVIYAFIFIGKICLIDIPDRRISLAYNVLSLVMVMFTLYRCDGRLPVYDEDGAARERWESIYDTCDRYAASGDILYVAPLGYNALINDRYLYDNGHEMAINEEFYEEYKRSGLYMSLFPYAGDLMEKHLSYRDEMREKVTRQEYSLVTAVPGYETIADEDHLKRSGYELVDTYDLDMGRTSYEVQLWAPVRL